MNRIIKFRAWDTKRSKMFSAEEMGADELQLNPDGRGFFNSSEKDPRFSQYYSHMIPLQLTGLLDKNGKEIYEGDIVKSITDTDNGYKSFHQEQNCEVRYMGSSYKYGANEDSWWHDLCGSEMSGNKNLLLEIIGNIYENPELLK